MEPLAHARDDALRILEVEGQPVQLPEGLARLRALGRASRAEPQEPEALEHPGVVQRRLPAGAAREGGPERGRLAVRVRCGAPAPFAPGGTGGPGAGPRLRAEVAGARPRGRRGRGRRLLQLVAEHGAGDADAELQESRDVLAVGGAGAAPQRNLALEAVGVEELGGQRGRAEPAPLLLLALALALGGSLDTAAATAAATTAAAAAATTTTTTTTTTTAAAAAAAATTTTTTTNNNNNNNANINNKNNNNDNNNRSRRRPRRP